MKSKSRVKHLAVQTLLAVGAAAVVASPASASLFTGSPSPSLSPTFGTLIDFDDQATGTVVGAFDYVAQGVASITETTGAGASFARYASSQSQPNYIGTGVGYEIGGAGLGWDGTIRIAFAGNTNKVGIGVANSAGGSETISAYHHNGSLLETYTVPVGTNVYVGIDRGGAYDIGYFTISGDFFAVDDLQFNAPIPEPEIYAMLGVGLGLMGWAARRRKQALAA